MGPGEPRPLLGLPAGREDRESPHEHWCRGAASIGLTRPPSRPVLPPLHRRETAAGRADRHSPVRRAACSLWLLFLVGLGGCLCPKNGSPISSALRPWSPGQVPPLPGPRLYSWHPFSPLSGTWNQKGCGQLRVSDLTWEPVGERAQVCVAGHAPPLPSIGAGSVSSGDETLFSSSLNWSL